MTSLEIHTLIKLKNWEKATQLKKISHLFWRLRIYLFLNFFSSFSIKLKLYSSFKFYLPFESLNSATRILIAITTNMKSETKDKIWSFLSLWHGFVTGLLDSSSTSPDLGFIGKATIVLKLTLREFFGLIGSEIYMIYNRLLTHIVHETDQ